MLTSLIIFGGLSTSLAQRHVPVLDKKVKCALVVRKCDSTCDSNVEQAYNSSAHNFCIPLLPGSDPVVVPEWDFLVYQADEQYLSQGKDWYHLGEDNLVTHEEQTRAGLLRFADKKLYSLGRNYGPGVSEPLFSLDGKDVDVYNENVHPIPGGFCIDNIEFGQELYFAERHFGKGSHNYNGEEHLHIDDWVLTQGGGGVINNEWRKQYYGFHWKCTETCFAGSCADVIDAEGKELPPSNCYPTLEGEVCEYPNGYTHNNHYFKFFANTRQFTGLHVCKRDEFGNRIAGVEFSVNCSHDDDPFSFHVSSIFTGSNGDLVYDRCPPSSGPDCGCTPAIGPIRYGSKCTITETATADDFFWEYADDTHEEYGHFHLVNASDHFDSAGYDAATEETQDDFVNDVTNGDLDKVHEKNALLYHYHPCCYQEKVTKIYTEGADPECWNDFTGTFAPDTCNDGDHDLTADELNALCGPNEVNVKDEEKKVCFKILKCSDHIKADGTPCSEGDVCAPECRLGGIKFRIKCAEIIWDPLDNKWGTLGEATFIGVDGSYDHDTDSNGIIHITGLTRGAKCEVFEVYHQQGYTGLPGYWKGEDGTGSGAFTLDGADDVCYEVSIA